MIATFKSNDLLSFKCIKWEEKQLFSDQNDKAVKRSGPFFDVSSRNNCTIQMEMLIVCSMTNVNVGYWILIEKIVIN